jgi:nucleotide-binding universal stress UspA family protein
MMRRILVGLDVSDPGSRLADSLPGLRTLGIRELVITHVARTSPSLVLYRKDPTLGVFGPLARAYAELAEEFSVELSVLSGAPAPELVHEAEARGAEAIAIGTNTRANLGEDRLGATAWGVVQTARLPILLLPGREEGANAEGEEAPVQISRIVHPTDFSPMASRALGFARDLAVEAGLPITLVHVLESGPGPGKSDRTEDAARQDLASIAEDLEAEGVREVEVRLRRGVVWKCILQSAEAEPGSLIVMGTRGRGFVSNLILGSQSREVVRRARDPMILIPLAWRGAKGSGGSSRSAGS